MSVAVETGTSTSSRATSTSGTEADLTTIRLIAKTNPKRAGSAAAMRFDRYTDGMTIRQAHAVGITNVDLKWDAERNFISIEGQTKFLPKLVPSDRKPIVSDRFDLRDRTAGEELWLWRRSRRSPTGRSRSRVGAGMSQKEAALELGVHQQRYNDAENDRLMERDILHLLACAQSAPGQHTQGELLALARRRSGRTLQDVCQGINISRPAYLKQERAAEPKVVSYWTEAGYSL